MSMDIPAFGRKPHTTGWLIAAIIFSIPSVLLTAYVYSEFQNINEFTILAMMLPTLILLLLGSGTLVLWVIWIFQSVRARKFVEHQKVITEITADMRRREAESPSGSI